MYVCTRKFNMCTINFMWPYSTGGVNSNFSLCTCTLHVFAFIPNIVPRTIGALCICNLQNVVKFNIFLQKNLCYVISICSFYWAKRNNRKYLYHAPNYYYYYWLTFGSDVFAIVKSIWTKKKSAFVSVWNNILNNK